MLIDTFALENLATAPLCRSNHSMSALAGRKGIVLQSGCFKCWVPQGLGIGQVHLILAVFSQAMALLADTSLLRVTKSETPAVTGVPKLPEPACC